MKQLYKQLDKDLSKVFFNSVEEMNECYGVDAKLPSKLYSYTDLVCYEIVEPFVCSYLAQYKFNKREFYRLGGLGEPVIRNWNEITLEAEAYEDDAFEHEGRYFVYVRVNEYLRKHLEKTLLCCEFVHRNNKADTQFRRFVHSVVVMKSGEIVVRDQDGVLRYLNNQLFYLNDYSDPIPYEEWVKQINKQDVDMED